MLNSKKRMAQGYSDLKGALERGNGSLSSIFEEFERASRDFLEETGKVPREVADDFLKQVARVGDRIKAGNMAGAVEMYEALKDRKKGCHKRYKD